MDDGGAPTRPDPLPPEARDLLDWMGEERAVLCWRTHRGCLLATNLRLVSFWRGDGLFREHGWHVGQQYFFFDLAPPTVVAGRFLAVGETAYTPGLDRYEIADPTTAARELGELAEEGRREWERRRARSELRFPRAPAPPPAGGREGVVREIVKVPCPYCGNLVVQGRARCPSCGAPQAR